MSARRTIVLAAATAVILAGCGTTPKPEPDIRPQVVKEPTPIACVVDPGPDPVYSDTDEAIAASIDIFDLAKLYRAGRLQRIAREKELKAALSGCAGR